MQPNSEADSGADSPHPNYDAMTALVIEDQPFVRRTIVQILREIGFQAIAEAADGAAGLAECIRVVPDIIVCDIEMRPVGGLDFLAGLRASPDVTNPRVPVLFLTNHTKSDIVKQAMSLGVNAFVVKPPSFVALKGRLERLLAPR